MLALDDAPTDTPELAAPHEVVQRYLDLLAQRRELESELNYLRGELELVAAGALTEAAPRARLLAPGGGHVLARLMPTCVFDRPTVARQLQREGRLADVATLTGPQLARFLAREPVVAARLGALVRKRHSVVLYAPP